jgi:Outer membrane protein beta-barrel domain
MKNKILIISFLGIFTHLKAQETISSEKVKTKVEIGVNTTLLFKQVFNFSDAKIATSPYVFTFKALRHQRGFRMGLGLNINTNNERQTTFADNKTVNNQSANLRLGYEWQRAVSPKWNVWFGTDLIGSYNNVGNTTDSGFDRVTISTKSQGAGLSLAFGAEWRFNEHFSIATEANLGAIRVKKIDGTSFSGGTQDDVEKINKSTDIATQTPTSLFLVYKF